MEGFDEPVVDSLAVFEYVVDAAAAAVVVAVPAVEPVAVVVVGIDDYGEQEGRASCHSY